MFFFKSFVSGTDYLFTEDFLMVDTKSRGYSNSGRLSELPNNILVLPFNKVKVNMKSLSEELCKISLFCTNFEQMGKCKDFI